MSNDPSRPTDERNESGITIVGGRPMHRAVDVSSLPVGVEQVLALAALNRGFRCELLADPQAAAARRGITLDDLEVGLLRSVPPDQLRAMAERAVVPPDAGRRRFVKAVSASVVALVTGGGYMLCSGCTGADGWDSSGPQFPGGAIQQWRTYDEQHYYLYVPTEAQYRRDVGSGSVPHMVCFHGADEDCLSQVQRWYKTADAETIVLLSVNWSDGDDVDDLSVRCRLLLDDYLREEAVSGVSNEPQVLCGRGAAAPIVWKAAYDAPGGWSSVLLLGGMPIPEDTPDEQLPSDGPALYWIMGEDDGERAAAQRLAERLMAKGLNVGLFRVVPGTSDRASLNLTWLWRTMTS